MYNRSCKSLIYKEEYKNVDKSIQTSVIKKVQSTKIGFSK